MLELFRDSACPNIESVSRTAAERLALHLEKNRERKRISLFSHHTTTFAKLLTAPTLSQD